jgi:hypothetical protein
LNSIMDKETKSSKNPGFRILPSDIPFWLCFSYWTFSVK